VTVLSGHHVDRRSTTHEFAPIVRTRGALAFHCYSNRRSRVVVGSEIVATQFWMERSARRSPTDMYRSSQRPSSDMEPHYATIWEAIADAIPMRSPWYASDSRRSWASFEHRSSLLAGALEDPESDRGSKVGLFLYNSPEFMETVLCFPQNPSGAVQRQLSLSRRGAVLSPGQRGCRGTHFPLQSRSSSSRSRRPDCQSSKPSSRWRTGRSLRSIPGYEEVLDRAIPSRRMTRRADDITMIYTGGTTRMPKGVMTRIGHRLASCWPGTTHVR